MSELDRWGLPGARGPYAFSQTTLRVGRDWLPKLVIDAWPIEGDDAAAAVVRHAVAVHVVRLAERRHPGVACVAWRAIDDVGECGRHAGPLAVWVNDSHTLLVGSADAARLGAVLLAATNPPEDHGPLELSTDELDTVQRAAILVRAGHSDQARELVVQVKESESLRWILQVFPR